MNAFQRDPRTVAREIPGLFEAVFPQLSSSVVMHLNRMSIAIDEFEPVSHVDVICSSIPQPMLFEIAQVLVEQRLNGAENIQDALLAAYSRQSRYFDARLVERLSSVAERVIMSVAGNLHRMLTKVISDEGGSASLEVAPVIPGFQWLASGKGDFAVERTLIEVKCANKSFSSADYRQIIVYWVLSYINSLEGGGREWSRLVLLNPRLNKMVRLRVKDILELTSAGRSKIEIVEMFTHLIAKEHA
ncbi:hypothetical protein [Herbaspirillum frisingense]|nr:hypothetical protein [Herbaspirillum frisingense]